MYKYLLDSNILIDYLRGHSVAVDFLSRSLSRPNTIIAISGISELEIYTGKSLDFRESKHKADRLLDILVILPVDSLVCRRAGELLRHLNLDIPDAVIAATALIKDYAVVTKNIKHFQKIKDLKIFSP